ncbi:redoxin domain-containing protein [Candidatus Dependentiae bacterium]|nr:redoxin domain-containing protein [Candidatus Dependentiae bacterium]
MDTGIMKFLFLGIICLGIIATGFFFFQSPSPKKAPLPKTLEWLTQEKEWFNVSRPLHPTDLHNRILVVDFWTAGCINCMHVMPELAALEDQFKEKITVIGVHSGKFLSEHVEQTIRDAIKKHTITHPVVNDKNFVIWKAFGVHSWPTLLVIDPNGRIYREYQGEKHQDEIARDIQELLKQFPDPTTTPLSIKRELESEEKSVLLFPGKLCYAPNFQGKPALFIADSGHHNIVITRLDGQIIQTIGSGKPGFADGDFQNAEFNAPQGLLWHEEHNALYVADTKNHMLRKIDFDLKTVTRLAGTGGRGSHHVTTKDVPRDTALASPWDLAFFPAAPVIAISQAGTHQIWLYELSKNRLRILTGNGREGIKDGQHPYATLAQPSGLAAVGDTLYFVDAESSALRIFKGHDVKTLIGKGLFNFGFTSGKANDAQLQHPQGIVADKNGVYIADTYNHAIRFYNQETHELSTLIGNGIAGDALGSLEQTQLNEPNGIAQVDNTLYIADTNNHRIVIAYLAHQKCSVLNIK